MPKETTPDAPAIVKPAISPGSIRLTGILGECEVGARMTECGMEVVLVQEYGSGTPQLPAGTQIRITFLNSYLEGLTKDSPDAFGTGARVVTTISRMAGVESSDGKPAWKVVIMRTEAG